MKKLLATLLILPLFLTSCLGNDEPVESTTTLKYLGNNHIYSSEETILKNAEYTLDMNFTAMTTTLTINSAYTSNGEPVTIRLKDIKMEFSQDKGYTFQVAEMVPEVSDGNAEDYAVSNLNARIYPYYKSDDQVGMKQIIIMEIWATSTKYSPATRLLNSRTRQPQPMATALLTKLPKPLTA